LPSSRPAPRRQAHTPPDDVRVSARRLVNGVAERSSKIPTKARLTLPPRPTGSCPDGLTPGVGADDQPRRTPIICGSHGSSVGSMSSADRPVLGITARAWAFPGQRRLAHPGRHCRVLRKSSYSLIPAYPCLVRLPQLPIAFPRCRPFIPEADFWGTRRGTTSTTLNCSGILPATGSTGRRAAPSPGIPGGGGSRGLRHNRRVLAHVILLTVVALIVQPRCGTERRRQQKRARPGEPLVAKHRLAKRRRLGRHGPGRQLGSVCWRRGPALVVRQSPGAGGGGAGAGWLPLRRRLLEADFDLQPAALLGAD